MLTKEVEITTMMARFAQFLAQQDRILLTTHENPDGDGIGAMLGLAHYLKAVGKEVRIVVSPCLPANLRFLDPQGWVEAFDPEHRHQALSAWPSTWLLVDASEPHRLGPLHAPFLATQATRACLDHHLKDAPEGFDAEFTDPSASASAELVYDLAVLTLPLPLPAPMAEALYTGVVDDTGNFRFSNATGKVHRLAAQLIDQGVAPSRIYQNLYHQGRPERLRLSGRAFEGMVLGGLDGQAQYARLSLTQADFLACEANHDDMDGLVNRPLELAGVEVACLLHELEDGRIKASLRSRERVNVNAICRQFGGGGHRLASGAKLPGPMAQAQADLDRAILAQLAVDVPVPA